MTPARRILLTGASGYVGGRLLPRLERRGFAVRCLTRRPELLTQVGPSTQVVAADALRPETLPAAFEGVDTAFYLIHSMGNADGPGFEAQDRQAASNFARAAQAAGVRRIVYLGGLGDERSPLSAHLRSRHEVGEALRSSGVPVLEFRASIVIGSGSLSFEMIRALIERLPVMVTPRWVSVVAQPIAIDDLLAYLEAAVDLDAGDSRIYEIGGAQRASYAELMREYARQRGLHRLMIPVPVLTPRLSSLWLWLVTPLYARVGRKLIESICHETIVRDDRARRDFDVVPMGIPEAIGRALDRPRGALRARRLRRILVSCLVWLVGAHASAATPELERADALWARRAEGQVEGRALPERTAAAVAAYEQALAADPESLAAHWKLLRALWFSADFSSPDAAAERAGYEAALAVSERALARLDARAAGADTRTCRDAEALRARLPAADHLDAAALYFWYGVNLGAWSRVAGLVQAVRSGAANRLHAATLCSLVLDPSVEQGGAIRLLSRLHSELPRVPLVSGWVDPRRAVPLAERALAEFPRHPGNAYLLGLALLAHAPERRDEALRLVEATAWLEPRVDHVVEDLAIRLDAQQRLARERRRG